MKGKGDNDDEGSCRGRDAKAKCLSQAKQTHDLTLHAKLSSYASEVTVEGSGLSTRWITFLRIFNQALGFFRQTTFRSARSLLWALVRFVLRAISLEPTTVTVLYTSTTAFALRAVVSFCPELRSCNRRLSERGFCWSNTGCCFFQTQRPFHFESHHPFDDAEAHGPSNGEITSRIDSYVQQQTLLYRRCHIQTRSVSPIPIKTSCLPHESPEDHLPTRCHSESCMVSQVK